MKKLDRTEHIEDIFDELRKLANNDMRIGQSFEVLRGRFKGDDLFNIENDKLLKLLQEFNQPLKS